MPSLPNRELVVYALAVLGGESQRVHTEDLAIKCHELFPESFSWTKYPQLPDKDIVRVALTDARKPQWGRLVEGRSGEKQGHAAKTNRKPEPDGWRLTEEGIKWIAEHGARLEALTRGDSIKPHRQKVLKRLKRLREHLLFLEYTKNKTSFAPAIADIADFVRCRVDASDDIWTKRFDEYERLAAIAGEEEFREFVDRCRVAYLAQH